MWSSSQASTRGVVEMGRVEAGPSHFPKRPAPRNSAWVNLSRTHAVKPCSAGDRPGISVKCNLGWSSQPSPDLRHNFRGFSSPSEAVLTSQSDLRKLFVGNEKIGVLLLNLGGPETLDDVQPFLFNLFADPDIIRLPRLFRFLQKPLAKFISVVRAPKSKEGYASIGGGSPLRQITDAQAEALREALHGKDVPAKVYVGMRYWHPFTEEAIEQIKRDGITKLVVLPLYPQFSISTSGSSLRLLESIFREDEYLVNMQHTVIPSWYQREGYIKAMATLIENELTKFPEPQKVRGAMTSSTCGSLLSQRGRRLLDLVDIYFSFQNPSYSLNKALLNFQQAANACKKLSVLFKGVECIILKEKKGRRLNFFRNLANCLF